jgi:CheY-like chemotaxis protein
MAGPLPLARVALHPPPTRRVLVIDDDQLVCQMLADAFGRWGFETVTAADGEAGLRRLIDELLVLDLVVTDLLMPGIDGEGLVHRVRHVGGEHDLAIVVASAHLTPDARARLDAMGADAVIDKAVGPDKIAELAVTAYDEREAQLGHS